MSLRLEPVQVLAGRNDREGLLVFYEDLLVAVLVRLSDDHGSESGKWFLEAGFGWFDVVPPPTFGDINEARKWILREACETGPARGNTGS